MFKFEDLNLSENILKAIDELGFNEPTQIQYEAIPAIISGKDVLGKSHTGTGKTAAFGIPVLETINETSKHPQVLILCPTRELVIQVTTELRKFSKYKEGIKIVPIYGGQPIDQQIKLLKRGVEIIVGTPGRVMDHLNRKTIKFTELRTVILDEADEMLNMGFKEDIESILTNMPEGYEFQMVLFSATMPKEILQITEQFQENPLHIEIKSATRTIDTVEQEYYIIPRGKKQDATRLMLHHYSPNLTMIFANTKKMVDELVDHLNNNDFKAIGLHGDMKQASRTRVMEQFRTGNYPILIATDVAARGIDVDNIDLVINFDIPQDNEYYIHRIGRTGRAGKKGRALTLVSGTGQKKDMKAIMKYTKTVINESSLPTSVEMKEASINTFVEKVLSNVDNFNDECVEITNRLLSHEISAKNILSALVSMNYKSKAINIAVEEKAKKTYDFETTTLKVSLGRNHGVSPSHIVAAISEEASITSNFIGKITVLPNFSLVDIEASKALHVLQSMAGVQIRNKDVTVTIDKGSKDKGGFEDFPKRNRSKESEAPSRESRGRGKRDGSRDGRRAKKDGGKKSNTDNKSTGKGRSRDRRESRGRRSRSKD